MDKKLKLALWFHTREPSPDELALIGAEGFEVTSISATVKVAQCLKAGIYDAFEAHNHLDRMAMDLESTYGPLAAIFGDFSEDAQDDVLGYVWGPLDGHFDPIWTQPETYQIRSSFERI